MTDHVYLSADRTRLVPEHAAGKKWQVSRAEAVKLGLLDAVEKPVQVRRSEPQQRRVAGPLRTVEQVGPTAPKRKYTKRK